MLVGKCIARQLYTAAQTSQNDHHRSRTASLRAEGRAASVSASGQKRGIRRPLLNPGKGSCD